MTLKKCEFSKELCDNIKRCPKRFKKNYFMYIYLINYSYHHGCQNPDLYPIILRFYDSTCPKRSGSFKNLCDHSGSVGLYDSDNPK